MLLILRRLLPLITGSCPIVAAADDDSGAMPLLANGDELQAKLISVATMLLFIPPTDCIRCRDVFVVTVVIIVLLDGVPFRHEWCIGMR